MKILAVDDEVIQLRMLQEAIEEAVPDCDLRCFENSLEALAWANLDCPNNIILMNIPPYTPEMNPIEQIWRELRTSGFRNQVFVSLEKVVDRLCFTINNLSHMTIISISQRDWICDIIN